MKLHYKIHGAGKSLLLLHGLFGSLDNLGVIARHFCHTHQVIQVDLRNHGLSPWNESMSYDEMAQDIIELIDELNIDSLTVIGHSMGGKVAMKLGGLIPHKIEQMVILDMAPSVYLKHRHESVFYALNTCLSEKLVDRKLIERQLEKIITKPIAQFLLKSYKDNHWLFNIKALENNYAKIGAWDDLPTSLTPILFLKGESSNYINDANLIDLYQQYPYALVKEIKAAGHNVHLDNSIDVINEIQIFISPT